ncbi:ATP-binding cassette domain-containing protein [Sinomicrobium weinanense]|uniref:ATP-binding cassette domain-containing protein n=1 Tax=Sinomicrobium weinanense TaxID=2842200 RepID=A0A926Q3Q2_9FLAO|nr:ATP-binding cassette domain-containing protein [Sinomicrobium weinanense]MBC9796241.1 ATP-binding cassette domain-containing protein [Sinomicrobium weinanense]MBU3122304.1 ATP-binding cassette domain-containing protein [Sinomicrobium weinanense]
MSLLHIDSIRKIFPDKQLLTDVFITCKSGEIVGLLGRNGSGKSTLLKIIFGSIPAENKFVRIDEKVLKGVADTRNLIKYLPQDNFLPDHTKVKTIISLFCHKKNAEKIKNYSHIRPLLNRTSKQLSSGEKRLIEVLLIVFSNAKFILIDEPFNGIAPVYKDDIKAMIREQSEHKGFIITDHDYKNITGIATKTILLHDGGTKQISDKDELKHWGYIPGTA